MSDLRTELCPVCGHLFRTLATKPGEHCVCFNCGELFLLDDQKKLRIMTEQEGQAIADELGRSITDHLTPEDFDQLMKFARIVNRLDIDSNSE